MHNLIAGALMKNDDDSGRKWKLSRRLIALRGGGGIFIVKVLLQIIFSFWGKIQWNFSGFVYLILRSFTVDQLTPSNLTNLSGWKKKVQFFQVYYASVELYWYLRKYTVLDNLNRMSNIVSKCKHLNSTFVLTSRHFHQLCVNIQ